MDQIILASASPRRQELLKQIGLDFTVFPSTIEENTTETNPTEYVRYLSYSKAMDVAQKQDIPSIIIGADTIVTFQDQILGKPKDKNDAYDILNRLQGNTHSVYSGVTLIHLQKDHTKTVKTFHCETKVTVLPMTREQILDYIATGDPMDKAGAYGIQGYFAQYIEGIEGDYYNVVGLPLSRLMQEMEEMK